MDPTDQSDLWVNPGSFYVRDQGMQMQRSWLRVLDADCLVPIVGACACIFKWNLAPSVSGVGKNRSHICSPLCLSSISHPRRSPNLVGAAKTSAAPVYQLLARTDLRLVYCRGYGNCADAGQSFIGSSVTTVGDLAAQECVQYSSCGWVYDTLVIHSADRW